MDATRLQPAGWIPGTVSLASVAVVLAVTTADILTPTTIPLAGLVIIGPLLCGLRGSRRATWVVSVLAVAVGALAFTWDHSFGSGRWWIPLVVIAAAGIFSIQMASYRSRLLLESERIRVLADLGAIATAGRPSQELAEAVTRLLVPRLVDLCVIDAFSPGRAPRRLAGAFSGDPAALEAFMARPPGNPGARATSAEGQPAPAHHPRIDEATRAKLAHDEEHLRILRELEIDSAVTVPLGARGSAVGSLIVATRPPRRRLTRREDVEFLETLASRLALALDNADLVWQLSSSERERNAILSEMAAAVIVRAADGRAVYVNQAAADLLKLPSPQAVMEIDAAELIERFDAYTEDGERVELDDLPGARLLRGETAPPPLSVRNVFKETGDERWLLTRATALLGAEGEVRLTITLIEDVTASKRNEIAERLLVTAARELAEAEELDPALQAVTDAMVPSFADWASVDLWEDGRLRAVAISHRDPEKVRLGRYLRANWPAHATAETGIVQVIRTGEAELIRDIPEEMLAASAQSPEHLEILQAVGLKSMIVAPLRAGDQVLGTLAFVSSTSRRFDQRDLDLARNLGRQIGTFVSNAQLHSEQAHIASTLQGGLVPDILPRPGGWAISSAYRAAGRANEVGGDFYDVVEFSGGWAAIIGDVVGKGAVAASLTALVRHTLSAVIKATGDAESALTVLNRRLRERPADAVRLTTAAVLMISQQTGELTVLSAGHPLPLLRREGEVEAIGITSPLLGYLDELELQAGTISTRPGDEIILYTDGIIDATGRSDRFGEARLLDTIRRLPTDQPENLAGLILEHVEAFLAGEQSDDIALLTLTRSREPRAP